MYNLKKSIMGKYNAADVDELLKKVRNDYEICLKEQKERIMKLRSDNKEISERLKKYIDNERYIIAAITKAEETAESILAHAKQQATQDLLNLRNEEKQLRFSVSGSCERLKKLGEVSDSIHKAISKVLGEDEVQEAASPRPNIYRVT